MVDIRQYRCVYPGRRKNALAYFPHGPAHGALGGLYILLKGWSFRQFASLTALAFFGFLAVLTIRTSIRANYVLYDTGMEYLVYAHGFTGVKDVIRQVEDLSNKTTSDSHAIVVA